MTQTSPTINTPERPVRAQTNSQLAMFICRFMRRDNLSRDEASDFLGCLLEEASTDGQIAAALVALAFKGETVDELVGCANAMRSRSVPVRALRDSFVDTAGTGSSPAKTFNVSTAAAFVISGAGVSVAKHGNRAVTSHSGSSDVLARLGVRVDTDRDTTEKCLNELGICFMFAPLYHGSTKRVAAIRRELGVRTIFNLLGPLTNPAGAPFQIIGVSQAAQAELLARALSALGTKRAWVVHGTDGLDEVTLAGKTLVAEAHEGSTRTFELTPESFGMNPASLDGLASADAEMSAKVIRQILSGELRGPARDLVIVNAAAALFVAGAAGDLLESSRLAAISIDTGAAAAKLDRLVNATNA